MERATDWLHVLFVYGMLNIFLLFGATILFIIMDQSLKEKFKNVIMTLGEQFTSHDFIKKFLAEYEDDYREWFANASLQSVNAKG